jgi:hypothetical protein
MSTKTGGDPIHLIGTVEPLHPDLQASLRETPIGLSLKHPLVFSCPYNDTLSAYLNAFYAQKQTELERARTKRAWPLVIWLHERPFRWRALDEIALAMTDDDYWTLLADVWQDTENLWEEAPLIRRLLAGAEGHPITGRPAMMTPEERAALAAMADTLTVYRGVKAHNVGHGLSWTVDRKKAVWFAQRFDGNGYVYSGTVSRSNVIAYFVGRGESEIVALPGDVSIQRIRRSTKRR